MAILESCNDGWIISHELFINNLYLKTNWGSRIKSFSLKSSLFNIEVPFVNRKYVSNKSDKTFSGEVKIVKQAYDVLVELCKTAKNCSSESPPKNNYMAKSLADKIYSDVTNYPDFKFIGGNSSDEPLITTIGNGLYLIPKKCSFYCYDILDIAKHVTEKFDFILMDPPWWNKFIRRKRKKNSKFGYEMVYHKELLNIPINDLLHDNGIIAIWCTNAPSHINAVINELFPAWNVEFLNQWFWLKITKLGKPVCDFSSSLQKQPYERIIFGKKKDSKRNLPNPEKVKIILSVPSAIHSHKPPICEVMKTYLPLNPKCLELFARYLLPHWTSYGNEVLKLQHITLYDENQEPS